VGREAVALRRLQQQVRPPGIAVERTRFAGAQQLAELVREFRFPPGTHRDSPPIFLNEAVERLYVPSRANHATCGLMPGILLITGGSTLYAIATIAWICV
jgi:hypothetical protein